MVVKDLVRRWGGRTYGVDHLGRQRFRELQEQDNGKLSPG